MHFYQLYIISLFAALPHLNSLPDEKVNIVPDYSGEILQYQLKYGIFHIGYATISFLEAEDTCGIHILSEARSTGLAKLIKNVDYRYEACMDQSTGLPNSALRNLRDGRYTVYNELVFDQHSRPDSAIVYSLNSGKNIVQKGIHDILTGFFHFREDQIHECRSPGDSVVIKTFFTDELWDLNIRYSEEESISTNYGQIDCIKFLPETVVGRYFRTNDAMSVWFTKDDFSIPVKIKLNLIIGALHADLVAYKNPKNRPPHLVIRQADELLYY